MIAFVLAAAGPRRAPPALALGPDRGLRAAGPPGRLPVDAGDPFGLTIPQSWDFGHHDESLVLGAARWSRSRRCWSPRPASGQAVALAAFAAAALAVTVVVGQTQQEQYLDHRYQRRRRPAARRRLPLDPGVGPAAEVRQRHHRLADRRRRPRRRLRPVLLLRQRSLQPRPVPGRGAPPGHLPPDRRCATAATRSTRATTTTSWSRTPRHLNQDRRPPQPPENAWTGTGPERGGDRRRFRPGARLPGQTGRSTRSTCAGAR